MNRRTRFISSFVFAIVAASVILMPVAGSLLENKESYLPVVVNSEYTPTNTPSPTPEPNATNTPFPTPRVPTRTPTPTPTEKPNPVPSGDIRIRKIFYDGIKGSQEPDEYVEIKNFDSKPIQLEGWTLRDAANHIFIFPAFIMETGKVCRVYTNEIHSEWCGFSYGSGSAIWNNGGDCADLRNSNGTTIDKDCY